MSTVETVDKESPENIGILCAQQALVVDFGMLSHACFCELNYQLSLLSIY